jgi:hypothetical protein
MVHARSSSIVAAAVVCATAVFQASPAAGQAISPMITEYRINAGSKVKGAFEVRNPALVPVRVVLEPLSFSVDSKGDPTYRKLDPAIRVRFTATSFRISPRQNYSVGYEVESDRLPAWFTVYATIVAANVETVKVALKLPHTVYVLPKEAISTANVEFLRSETSKEFHTVSVDIRNIGVHYGRVEAVEVSSPHGKVTYNGFPFFPGQQRELRLPWNEHESPTQVVLRFKESKATHPLSDADARHTTSRQ